MIRRIGALVAGIVVAFVVVALVEAVGHSIYGAPGPDVVADTELMREFVAGLPVGALLFVLAAWYLGTFCGGLLACFIAKSKPFFHASLIGVFLLGATVMNLLIIPHPIWFFIAGVVGILASTLLTARVAERRFGGGEPSSE